MLTIRPSSIARNRLCGASAVQPRVTIRDRGSEADTGTAVHAVLSRWIKFGEPHEADPAELAAAYGVDETEVRILAFAGWKWWRAWGNLFPQPHLEEELGLENVTYSVQLVGHPDIWSYCDGTIRVADWFTGYGLVDKWDQVNAYAYLALQQEQRAMRFYQAVVPLRHGSWDARWIERAELEAWWQETLARLTPDYSPGSHCGYCPRRHECAGFATALHSALAIAAGDAVTAKPELAPQLYSVGKFIEATGANMKDLAKALVIGAGGSIVAEGRELTLVQQEQRRIDWPAAESILRMYLTDEQIDACLTISKTKVESEVRSNAPRGEKKLRVEQLLGELAAAGCLSTTFVERLELRAASPLTLKAAAT